MTNSLKPTSALRFGILGCANIAKQFARDVAASSQVKLVAVASRQLDKAAAFAQTYGIQGIHGSYEALLADPEVDAIYLPLPNSLHAEWAIRAAEAGKHVLCEKPLALNLTQARNMFEAARQNQVMLLEAFPYYFQPQTDALLELLCSGEIGTVRSMQACFGFTLSNPATNIRLRPELGGGALLDAGSYPLSLIRLVMGCAPQRVMADASWSDTGVDISLMATLYYADGRRAQLSCAMDTANYRRATIAGSEGTIETEYLNHTCGPADTHPFGYLPSQLRVRRGIANTVAFEDIATDTGSGFQFAAEALARLVQTQNFDAVVRYELLSLDNAATLEAIAQSAHLGHAVDVVTGIRV